MLLDAISASEMFSYPSLDLDKIQSFGVFGDLFKKEIGFDSHIYRQLGELIKPDVRFFINVMDAVKLGRIITFAERRRRRQNSQKCISDELCQQDSVLHPYPSVRQSVSQRSVFEGKHITCQSANQSFSQRLLPIQYIHA